MRTKRRDSGPKRLKKTNGEAARATV